MMTESQQNKIESLKLEYAARKDNKHVGSGLGGNSAYWLFMAAKEHVIDPTVQDVSILDKFYWNEEFLGQSKLVIRGILDSKVQESIDNTDFKLIIKEIDGKIEFDSSLIDKRLAGIIPTSYLIEPNTLPNVSSFDYNNRVYIASIICNAFAAHLDNDPNVKDLDFNFVNLMLKFDMPTQSFAIRTQISIDRIVKHELDEFPALYSILKSINTNSFK